LTDKSPDDLMQELLPGSKTFRPRILCPNCGWHFKHGLTDPKGQHGELVPDVVVVCGQCLRILKTNERLELAVLSAEDIKALDAETRDFVAKSWHVAYLALLLVGPEPKGPVQ
jgi:hypothetical protein